MELTHNCPGRSCHESIETPAVFVIDPDASVRDALESQIRSCGWRPILTAAADDFLAEADGISPCCLLVELNLPGLGAFELQRLVTTRIGMPVIFMSRDLDAKTIVQAMKAGAFEFLIKPIAKDRLSSVVQLAIEISRASLRNLAHVRSVQQRYESLSRREREVMNLVVSGRLNKQVGFELGISEITVKAHRGKMMRKMKAASLAELVSLALNLGQDRTIQGT